MGFNPRLALYSVRSDLRLHFETATDTNSLHREFFRFPQAGEIIGAEANLDRHLIGAVNAGVEATTGTGVDELSLWKFATDDTTATYATSLRSYQRTGAQNSSTGGGLNWHLSGTSGDPGLYTFSNNNTSASARNRYNAGDVVMLHARNYGATDTSRIFEFHVQMDYMIGYEDGAVPTIAAEPAED